MELIVVLILMGIAASAAVYTITSVASMNAKTAARDLKAELEETRDLAMSRGGGKLKLYVDADGDIWADRIITNDVTDGATTGEKKKIGSSKITITYHVKSSTDTVLTAANPCEFSFNPGTGEFTGTYIDSITVSGGGKSVKLTLWRMTGKIEIE